MTTDTFDEMRLRAFLNATYAPATARKYLGDIKAYVLDPSVATRPDITIARRREYVYAWKALEYYVARTGAPMLDVQAPPIPEKLRGGRKTRESHHKRKIKTRFTRDEWRTLWNALDPTRPTDVVLRLQMQTALRVSDVLRVEREALSRAMPDGAFVFAVKGGKESSMPITLGKADWVIALNGMKGAGAHNIARWVSSNDDPSGAAYHRTLRRLMQVGEEEGLTTPHTTHRIRRSLATFLLEDGATPQQIQQVLDHENMHTTDIYMQGAFATTRGTLLSHFHQQIIAK